jgi:signal transduction histidine kinase
MPVHGRPMTNASGSEAVRALCERIRALATPDAPLLAREVESLFDTLCTERVERGWVEREDLDNANRLATVGTLAAGMAHELGTPLGVVLVRAQMIVEDESDVDEIRRDAAEIVNQVTRMTQMCREVLDFARPRPRTREQVDVAQVLRNMIALLAPRMRTGPRVVLAGDPVRTLVWGDPSKLMQIFTNLTINAAQAMPGGGTVALAVSRRRVHPPGAENLPDADYVCVDVTDDGTGIRAADLDRIFQTFFTTKKAEGMGIGLAVSARIAREHDGWIGVVSREGHGSTFTVYLPPLGVA